MIILIAATDDKGGIGKNDTIPWRNKEDMKFFRDTTLWHPVVMGSVTYRSIVEVLGNPLPNRENIILSKFGSVSVQSIVQRANNEKIYIIGGESIYRAFLPYADEIILTRIPGDYACDRFFPDIPPNWTSIKKAVGGLDVEYFRRKATSD